MSAIQKEVQIGDCRLILGSSMNGGQLMRKLIHDHGFEWFILPLGFVAFIHFAVWAIASSVVWDVFWISAFTHRLLFAALCVFVWGSLIADVFKDDNKEPDL